MLERGVAILNLDQEDDYDKMKIKEIDKCKTS